MKTITLHSDVHKEFYRDTNHQYKWFFKHRDVALEPENVDVCVLAGDIIAGNNKLEFIDKICDTFPNVVHVAGNHEHYQGCYDEVLERLKAHSAKRSNYHFLERDTVTIDGQRFVGCTMWYLGDGKQTKPMNDFYVIKKKNGSFYDFVFDYGQESVQWLYDTATPSDVVVTHMLPCEEAIDDFYRGSRINCFYFNDARKVISDKKPRLWLHGHSHFSFDKTLGETRVVRNPKGYPGEYNPEYNVNLRITL